MDRGGVAVLQAAPNCHPNSASSQSSIHGWPIFFTGSQNLRRCCGCATGRVRRRLHQQPQPRRASSHFLPSRSCPSLVERRHMLMNKAVQQSSSRVLSSERPQEAVLSNEELVKDNLLIDCGPDQECVLGGIVALGKFDALHIGHRQLAIQASKAGTPFLLSFVGIAEVLGWESRPPIVANCDRKRVFSSWAPYCGNITPLEYHVEFSKVRYFTPQQFVERLSMELKNGDGQVLATGENYRFGYKASGDAAELVRLCKEYGLSVFIVNSVMDKAQRSYNGSSINSRDKGQVSSTRVRHALAMGDMEYVRELLGRRHRLLLMLDEKCFFSRQKILARKSCMLNLPPADGVYNNCSILVEEKLVGPAKVVIGVDDINIEMKGKPFGALDPSVNGRVIGIEFD